MGLLSALVAPGRRLPDIRQAEATECGLACLAMVSCFHDRHVDLNALRREHPVSLKGMTLKTLMDTAGKLGFNSRPLRLELAHLKNLQLPAILHWDMAHYVVLKSAGLKGLVIHDPGLGPRRYTLQEASKHFTGIALELMPSIEYNPPPPLRKLSMGALFGPIAGLRKALAQVLVLSIILQIYVLASPFYLQLVVDDAVAMNDPDLAFILALGFGLFLLINTGAAIIRTRLLAHIQSSIAFQMGAGLFKHLLRLPLVYFEKRHVGDLVSRFGSTEPIRHLFAEGLISVGIDGVMAVLTLTMIFIYAPSLGAIVLAALFVYVLLRIVFFHKLRRSSLDLMVARAREGTTFIETVRAIQSIKLFGREAERCAVWMNHHAELIRADTSVTLLKQTFHVLNDLVFGIENVFIIYLGAQAVLADRMTIGMLFAFMAYKQQFVSKASALVEKAIEFQMLDLYLGRLADITSAEPEDTDKPAVMYPRPLNGSIEVRSLAFRYAEGEPFIFENISFSVQAGDYVAVTGPSGQGKTTLIKILVGLLKPTKGQILIDGVPLQAMGTEVYRKNIGVVMQDDHLLSGTIADNICFFDERFDLEQMTRCAMLAGLHDEIAQMPMAYNSLIGDMGTSLSGGQRQRLLLARALYKKPRILFMDEGTSNLDLEMERHVSRAIQGLGLTRVIVAHRTETINSAGRRLIMNKIGLREDSAEAALESASSNQEKAISRRGKVYH
jgi:ATP-binding cassette, subfamily B, bacterial CvaB/MchF/RaxB